MNKQEEISELTKTFELSKEEVITIINAFYACCKTYGKNKRQYEVAKKLLGEYPDITGMDEN